MDGSARWFLCARCLIPVRLCSRCDRGQRYCTSECSRQARDSAQREAGRRYQRSRAGRLAHAARSRRWRGRHHDADGLATPVVVGANIVTHQGSPQRRADAPLAACTRQRTEVSVPCDPDQIAAQVAPRLAAPRCARCGTALGPWVRQGFLRTPARRATRHDHSP